MTILRIEEMTYGVEDIIKCSEFLETWGLQKVSIKDNIALFKTYENQLIRLRFMNDPLLPPSYEEGPTMREVIWGVDNQTTLDEIESELSKDREVKKDNDGKLHSYDDRQNYLGFQIANIIQSEVEFIEYLGAEMNVHLSSSEISFVAKFNKPHSSVFTISPSFLFIIL